MTSRERVQNAITFNPPDRPPVDMDMSLLAYTALLKHLKLPVAEISAPNSAMEVLLDPSVLSQIGIDIVSLKPGSQRFLRSGTLEELPAVTTDSWGVTRKLIPNAGGAYYEIISHPLAGADLGELSTYAWPECDPDNVDEDLRDRAKELHETTDLALMGRFGGPIMEIAFALLGMEEWYIRLIDDTAFVRALLGHIVRICSAQDEQGINSCGRYLQIMKVSGEDLGMQSGLLYSPKMIHEIILPVLRLRWHTAKVKMAAVNPRAKIMLHSCGAISSLIPDLIESGIDILDPVQPNAVDMDPERLKSTFDNQIVFHGGIDIQHLLPFGTVQEVKQRTTEVLDGFKAAKGGFITAPSHCVQPDVPPQNILAMIDAAKNYSRR